MMRKTIRIGILVCLFVIQIGHLITLSFSTFQTVTEINQQYAIFDLNSVVLNKKISDPVELYVEIRIDSDTNLKTPEVENVEKGDKISYNWSIVMGATSEEHTITIKVRESDYGPDDDYGTVTATWTGEPTGIISSLTTTGDVTVQWQLREITANSPPSNYEPSPYLINNNETNNEGKDNWDKADTLINAGLLFIGVGSLIGVIYGVMNRKKEKMLQ